MNPFVERLAGSIGHALPETALVVAACAFILVGPFLLDRAGEGSKRLKHVWAGATLFILANLKLIPGGGEATELAGGVLVFAVVMNFILGVLMMLGIGLYAPCLILCSLLGLNPVAAFPIMMGSCAFLMPSSGLRFVARGRYSPGASLGLALGGVPAVLLAAYVVKSLPLEWLRWLVIVVVLIAATLMLRSALLTPAPGAVAAGEAP